MKNDRIFLLLTGIMMILAGCKKSDPVVDNTVPPLGSEQHLEILFVNNSGLPDDSIFFSCMGYQEIDNKHDYCWVDSNNQVIPVKMADNTISHNGFKYTNYSYSLKKVNKILLSSLNAARIRLTVGTPLWMKIESENPDANFSDANWNNPLDPNKDIIYDKVEFSYINNVLWMNTTSVDYFGIPYILSATVSGTDVRVGTSASRETVFNYFKNEAPADFKVRMRRRTEDRWHKAHCRSETGAAARCHTEPFNPAWLYPGKCL
ncbi:MAG: hypothetical protein IH596_13750 [Bacteroidales bacterium]|nr:hypothetical protein [Bacteroidales bacterium]